MCSATRKVIRADSQPLESALLYSGNQVKSCLATIIFVGWQDYASSGCSPRIAAKILVSSSSASSGLSAMSCFAESRPWNLVPS